MTTSNMYQQSTCGLESHGIGKKKCLIYSMYFRFELAAYIIIISWVFIAIYFLFADSVSETNQLDDSFCLFGSEKSTSH